MHRHQPIERRQPQAERRRDWHVSADAPDRQIEPASDAEFMRSKPDGDPFAAAVVPLMCENDQSTVIIRHGTKNSHQQVADA
jgi:hypothetical protein